MKKTYLLASCLLATVSLYAQPGTLDSDFDGDGKVTHQIVNEGTDNADAVYALPNGKILVAGNSSVGGTLSMTIIC